ncbi:hypothetical protein [Enterovirga sp.]|uniref:hypothetical protein n=1 Tax=Enterovirga sp. TaxID=2026350 RepID=UPI002B90ADF0|nr:hypothetical protein [Enterovirga sp.]HMO28344.1 hypothetical protein [Enterovirga sp.]
MISERVLDLAVERGLIAQGQALALRSLARETEAPPPAEPEPVDEERLRFVSGFADIFVTLGLGLFLGAAVYLVGKVLPPALVAAAAAAMSWGLAEFFTRRRRMALPSIVLLLVFVYSSFLALALLFGETGWKSLWSPWSLRYQGAPEGWGAVSLATAALGAAALAAVHYWRFRVPITVAAGICALCLSLLTVLTALWPSLVGHGLPAILLGLGLCIFTLAMRFDLSDPERATRRTDIAFWLHLLAAPLIVREIFAAIGVPEEGIGVRSAPLVLLIFAFLAVIAILVDRRALLVSGLAYAGWAFASLFQSVGLKGFTAPVTILVLGAFVLLLSAGWTSLREAALGLLPPRWAARLPSHAPR